MLNSRGNLNTAGSLNSSLSTSSMVDLPNLPGVRRDVSQINPKLYRQYKASTRGSQLDEENGSFVNEENSLFSFFDDSSKLELSRTLSPFPQNGSAYNDISGRYSLVSQKKDRAAKKLPLPYSSTDSLPSFVTNSAHVAHFLAYFDESATDGTETRSRKVEIKFYLEDNSLEILEPRVENSGGMAGKFLKRHQIFKPVDRISSNTSKTLYTLEDFYAGAQLNIYNRIYTVLECDNSTRAYMESKGLDFGFPLPVPKTVYDPKQRSSMSRPVTRVVPRSKRAGFFDYDRKVLRFFGVWDSRSMLFGDVIQVKLHYTLADDTIDIVAIPDRNSGRDPQTTLLRKSTVMKRNNSFEGSVSGRRTTSGNGSRPTTSDRSVSPTLGEPDRPYHWKDLSIGEVVSVAALNVLLTDADEFTREFYNSHNMPLGPPITLPEPNYSKLSASFSLNGDDDSTSLLPTAQPKDGLKAQLFQGMVLRYRAKIHNPKEADKSREFVIQVHLEDDSIQIKEPPIRNSGHKGGIFLARCKVDFHPNGVGDRDTGDLGSTGSAREEKRFLEPADVYLGAVVSIHAHKFDILDCDNYTFKYMEANPNLWRSSNLNLINNKLLDKQEVIRKVILTLPSLQSRSITVEELEEIFSNCGLELVKQEVYTVFRAIDVFRVGSVKLTKLLKYIIDLK